MQLVRQERHPLVALTALAFVMHLFLVVVATAVSPEAAAASGLTSLCQSSGQQETLPGPHDPLACQCGPVCAHGCTLQPCLAGCIPVQLPQVSHDDKLNAVAVQGEVLSHALRTTAIRAPPRSLI